MRGPALTSSVFKSRSFAQDQSQWFHLHDLVPGPEQLMVSQKATVKILVLRSVLGSEGTALGSL